MSNAMIPKTKTIVMGEYSLNIQDSTFEVIRNFVKKGKTTDADISELLKSIIKTEGTEIFYYRDHVFNAETIYNMIYCMHEDWTDCNTVIPDWFSTLEDENEVTKETWKIATIIELHYYEPDCDQNII